MAAAITKRARDALKGDSMSVCDARGKLRVDAIHLGTTADEELAREAYDFYYSLVAHNADDPAGKAKQLLKSQTTDGPVVAPLAHYSADGFYRPVGLDGRKRRCGQFDDAASARCAARLFQQALQSGDSNQVDAAELQCRLMAQQLKAETARAPVVPKGTAEGDTACTTPDSDEPVSGPPIGAVTDFNREGAERLHQILYGAPPSAGALLCDDPGAGKTHTAWKLVEIALGERLVTYRRPCLIVVPPKAVGHWQAECRTWCPAIHPFVSVATEAELCSDGPRTRAAVTIITSALFARRKVFEETIATYNWSLVIFDEVYGWEDGETNTSQHLRVMRNASEQMRLVGLTGTPVGAHLDNARCLLAQLGVETRPRVASVCEGLRSVMVRRCRPSHWVVSYERVSVGLNAVQAAAYAAVCNLAASLGLNSAVALSPKLTRICQGVDPDHPSTVPSFGDLELIQLLRGSAKLCHLDRWLRTVLEAGGKVAIFCSSDAARELVASYLVALSNEPCDSQQYTQRMSQAEVPQVHGASGALAEKAVYLFERLDGLDAPVILLR